MASFDVLKCGWIPVEPLQGKPDELGILETLQRAHELRAIRDPSPLVEFGLYRLLVAFVLDALVEAGQAPEDEFYLKDLLRAGRFDLQLLDRYVQKCGSVFDLFDAERPFLQTIAAGGGEKPLAALYPAVPSGINVHHWHHAREDAMSATPAEAARLLTTPAPFMMGVGAGNSPSINGAPGIYALPIGQNLFETLILNLPLRRTGTGSGQVAWRDSRIPGGERKRATMGEALTWRARRIRLRPPKEPGGQVTAMLFEAGDKTRFEWIDPNLAYRYGKDGPSPVRMREGRPLWRDAGPLALLNRQCYKTERDKFEYQRPDVVTDAFQVVRAPLHIRVYGMRTDNAKVFEWTVSELVVPCEAGKDDRVGALVQRWLDLSDEAGRALRNAVVRLYPREGAGNKGALGRTVEMAQRAYWNALEVEFRPLLERAGSLSNDDGVDDAERVQAAVGPWKAAIRQQALSAFERAAEDFDADADALERSVAAGSQLERRLYGILK